MQGTRNTISGFSGHPLALPLFPGSGNQRKGDWWPCETLLDGDVSLIEKFDGFGKTKPGELKHGVKAKKAA